MYLKRRLTIDTQVGHGSIDSWLLKIAYYVSECKSLESRRLKIKRPMEFSIDANCAKDLLFIYFSLQSTGELIFKNKNLDTCVKVTYVILSTFFIYDNYDSCMKNKKC